MKATRPSVGDFSLKKFLENDRCVLRFYCVWDDSTSVFGDLRYMVLNYFLSDDTIEIRESIPANSGRETNSLFLRRCRLPKNSNSKSGSEEFYCERDLMIGSIIHLYGRPFVICDCDEFTKNFYRENYGLENFDPVNIESYNEEPCVESFLSPKQQDKPMVIGNGSHEKKNFQQMMKYDGVVLRFQGVLNSNKQVDRDRKFVICYYMADDSISVFEPPSRNSGVLGGKFLEQKRIKKVNSDKYFDTTDFYIGKLL